MALNVDETRGDDHPHGIDGFFGSDGGKSSAGSNSFNSVIVDADISVDPSVAGPIDETTVND